MDTENCIRSGNFPSAYDNDETCVISVDLSRAGPISVAAFATESGYDKLFVNGNSYDGSTGPEGVVPNADIVWISDGSVTDSGWRICPASGTTSTTSVASTSPSSTSPANPDSMWSVTSGICSIDLEDCIMSPNFPANYGNGEACVISIAQRNAVPIQVSSFETESRYDFLVVNGVQYSGTAGPFGVVPNGDITWASDSTVTKSGWKLCPTTGGTTATTTQVTDVGYLWESVSPPCMLDSSRCATSPNFPADYGNGQTCVLQVNRTAAVPIRVDAFDTEYGFDKLIVNGQDFYGSVGPNNVVPTADVVWVSDSSIANSGWRLCPGR